MEQNNTQQQQFRCSGDCFRCIPMQRQYCAAQWSYNSMKMIESMQDALKSMSVTIADLHSKIEAIQGNEAMLFDPMEESVPTVEATEHETDTSQEGAGAKE